MQAPEGEKPDTRRDELTALLREKKFDQIGQFKGINVVESRHMLPLSQDCTSYALGMPFGPALIDKAMEIQGLPAAEEGKKGDYALYINKDGNVTHMGIYQGEGVVVSKWNEGDVYEHPLMLVPSSFGDEVRVVRDPNKNTDEITP